MAHRLLPFRQYSDHEVINLFSVNLDGLPQELKAMAPNDDGINADGVLVEIDAGNMAENDVVSVTADGRFQGQFAPPVGQNPYPTVPLKVKPCETPANAMGMTLAQTLSHDENSENLLYNPVKKDELNAVLSGQACPLATRGIFTLTQECFGPDSHWSDGPVVAKVGNWTKELAVGNAIQGHASVPGLFTGLATAGAGLKCGTVLATGERIDHGSADSWAGKYAVVQLSLPAS